jgi:hypothetical protein
MIEQRTGFYCKSVDKKKLFSLQVLVLISLYLSDTTKIRLFLWRINN